MNWKDIGIRAVKTAVATAVGLVLAAGPLDAISVSAAQAAGIAGLSAGATVLLNSVLNWSQSK